MNKNVIIGILVAAIIIIGGYFLFRTNNTTIVENTPNDTETPTSTTDTTGTDSGVTLKAPSVETSSDVSTSISTAFVTGQVTANGEPTTYWFDYGETSSFGSKSGSGPIGSSFSAVSSPAYLIGLKANTLYYFRLSASNNLGTDVGATYTFKTNNNPAPKSALPTVQTTGASSVSRTTANINGQVNPNGFQTSYWFEYGKDKNLNNSSSAKSISANTSSKAVSEALSGLDPLTKYYFQLDAQNKFGTVHGTVQSFTTAGPSSSQAPTVTTSQASNIASTSATLNGQINSNGADTTYWFEYSSDSLLSTIIGNGTPTGTVSAGTNTVTVQANVTGLNSKTKYYYHLVGRNSHGTTSGSIGSFTTKP